MKWTDLSDAEIERRRAESVERLEEIERQKFADSYQEKCDKLYWTHGQCCAGCDHWVSDMGMTGRCAAAGIVSGADVLKSMGVTWSSYVPPPGLPFSNSGFHCGKFKDSFDWSELDEKYLERIRAVRNGMLREKPQQAAQLSSEPHDISWDL